MAETLASRWFKMIKDIRQEFGVSIHEAERLAFSEPEIRRWCRKSVTANDECLKYAKKHIRLNGDGALFTLDGRTMKFPDDEEKTDG